LAFGFYTNAKSLIVSVFTNKSCPGKLGLLLGASELLLSAKLQVSLKSKSHFSQHL